ncbi:MAG: S8 family serine peptidase [Planctomycetota bacterium]
MLERRRVLAGSLDVPAPIESESAFETEEIFWAGDRFEIARGEWVVQFETLHPAPETPAPTSEADLTPAQRLLSRRAPAEVISETEGRQTAVYRFGDTLIRDAMLDAFRNSDSVISFEPNFVLQPTVVPNDARFDELWGLDNQGSGNQLDADIDAPEAWELTTGSSDVVVGVIDSGVDFNHEDLADNMWVNPVECPSGYGNCVADGVDDDGNGFVDDFYGWDFYGNDNDPRGDSHGTHVAGTIAAQGNNETGVTGVAWDAQIMAIRFLGPFGGTLSDAIESVNYATAMKRDYGVNVRLTNNSWGGGGFSQALSDAIAASRNADMLFIAAAGNDARNNDSSPAYPASYNLDNIISVAATTSSDELASFSNYGVSRVDLGAPGASILSTTPNDNYGYLSGTSMAAPHVAGVAALGYSINPTASYQEMRGAILSGTDRIAPLIGRTATGGRLNAHNTLVQLGFFGQLVTPEPGEIVSVAPTQFSIQFSGPVDASSLQPTDLTVNGISASSVSLADALTATFTFATSPATTEGSQSVAIAEDAIRESGTGDTNTPLVASFFFDPTPLVVTGTSPAIGQVLSMPNPSIRLDFSEPIAADSLGINDLALSEGRVQSVRLIDSDTVEYQLSGLDSESELGIQLVQGAILDDLGFPNQPFENVYPLDFVVADYPRPWEKPAPLGSRVWQTSLPGVWHASDDSDGYMVSLQAGQHISLQLAPLAGSSSTAPGARVRVLDPQGTTVVDESSGAGVPIQIQSLVASNLGDYTILVEPVGGPGAYELALNLGARMESELGGQSSNDVLAAAETLEGGWQIVSGDIRQNAVTGVIVGDADVDWYAFELPAGSPATMTVAGIGVQGETPFDLSLHASDGSTLQTGLAGNGQTRLADFVSDQTTTVFARVTGAAAAYSLTITSGASLDQDSLTTDSNTEDQPQLLPLPPRLVGHIGGEFETGPGIDSISQTSISLDTAPEGDMVRDLAYTPDGNRYLIAHRESENVLVYDSGDGTVIAEIPVSGKPVDIEITSNGLYALSANTVGDTVTVIDLSNYNVLAELPVGDNSHPYQVQVTSDGAQAVVATLAGEYVVYSMSDFSERLRFESSGLGVDSNETAFALAYNPRTIFHYKTFELTPDGSTLLGPGTVSTGNAVEIFDLSTGTLRETTPVPFETPRMVVTPDSSTAYVLSPRSVFGSSILTIDVATASVTRQVDGPGVTSRVMRLTPDGQSLISGSNFSLLFIDPVTGDRTSVSAGSTDSFDVSFDGQYVIAGDLIDIATRRRVDTAFTFTRPDLVVASPTEASAFRADRLENERYQLVEWTTTTLTIAEERRSGSSVEGDSPVQVEITSDGLTAVTANYDSQNISVIDLQTRTLTRSIDVGVRPNALALAPDGSLAILASSDGANSNVVLVDLLAGNVLGTFPDIDFSPREVAFSSDGSQAYVLTTGLSDAPDSVYFLEINGSQSAVIGSTPVGDTFGGNTQHSHLVVSPSGTTLAVSVSGESAIVFLDIATRQEVARVSTVLSSPYDLSFTPDGESVFVQHSAGVSSIGFDGTSAVLQESLDQIPQPISMAIDAAGEFVYVASEGFLGDSVYVIDAESRDVVNVIELPDEIASVGQMHLDGNTLLVLGRTAASAQAGAPPQQDRLIRLLAGGRDTRVIDVTRVGGISRSLSFSPMLQSAVVALESEDAVEMIDFSQSTNGDVDFISFVPQVGDAITIDVLVPDSGAGLIENTLDPAIELVGPNGQVVAAAASGPLAHTITELGIHTVRAYAQSFSEGEYLLTIDGVTEETGPSIVGVFPADGTVDVAPDAVLEASFDRTVFTGSGDIEIRRVADQSLFTSIPISDASVVIDDSTVRIAPAVPWELGTEYYVLFDSGTLVDDSSNGFAGIDQPKLWEFQIGFGFDFGDAPAPYPVTSADGGARHSLFGPFFGSARDSEPDGQPSTLADADDGGDSDDEDGVQFGVIRVGKQDATVEVEINNVTTTAFVDAWIDFNRDGVLGWTQRTNPDFQTGHQRNANLDV